MSDLYDDERAWELLGVMLSTPSLVADVVRVVEPDDFGEGGARKVYDAILRLFEAGTVPDTFLVRDELEDPKLALRVVDAMRDGTIVPGNAVFHAKRLRALGVLRQVRRAGGDLANVSATDDPAVILSEATDALLALGQQVPSSWLTPAEMSLIAEREIEETFATDHIVATGFPTLDSWLEGGLHPGRLYVLGARTSVGKSAWATNVVRHALDQGQRTLFVSLEMTGPEVLRRLVGEKYDVEHRDIPGMVNGWSQDVVQDWPLHFMGLANVATLAANARRLRTDKLRLVVVDYLQLLPSTGKFERRDLEIGYLTRSLKLLSVELGVPVLVLSQVNRAQDEGKPPTLRNLRESGNIEQDANVCLLLHRLHDHPERRFEARLAVAKNRHGAEGSISLRYQPERTRFTERFAVA